MKTGPERKSSAKRPCEFIEKLLQMMKNHPDFVMWGQEHGLLKFTKLKEFQTTILPNFFRHSNMLSFVRQLNMYYFSKRESSNSAAMEFHHDIFRRGNDANFRKIVRRNRFRDDVIAGLQGEMKETLEFVQKEHIANPQLREMLEAGIEYQEISIKAIVKLKLHVQELWEKLKNSRTKDVKEVMLNLQENSMGSLMHEMAQLERLRESTVMNLCRDLRDQQSPSFNLVGSQPILCDELKTVKNLGKLNNFRSKNSLVFENDKLEEEREFEDEPVSLEVDFNDLEFNQRNPGN